MDVIEISSDSSAPASPRSGYFNDDLNLSGVDLEVKNDCLPGRSSAGSSTHSGTEHLTAEDDSGTETGTIASNVTIKDAVHVLSSDDEPDTAIPSSFRKLGEVSNNDALPLFSKEAREDQEFLNVLDSVGKNSPPQARKKRKIVGTKAAAAKAERERKAAERQQKRLEAQQAKALKKAATIAQRVNRPGECLKYVQVMLDQSLLSEEFGGELLLTLRAAELQYTIQEQVVPHTITWVRNLQEHTLDENMQVLAVSKPQEEGELLVVRLWNHFLDLVHTQTLRAHLQSILSFHQGKKLTLLVFGLGDYFRFQKIQKQRDVKNRVRGEGAAKCAKKEAAYRDAPHVSHKDVEIALAELQILEGCSHRLVDQGMELGELVAHFTKAIAEKPFKLDKQKKTYNKLEWYATGDSRDCVRVDKNGLGLSRLWQQQLCQFPLVGLEVAEAIASKYPSPLALMQAYDRCSSQEEGEQLLKDIPIRRGVGPLTSVRKVGPELSRKMYVFFNSVEGSMSLSQD